MFRPVAAKKTTKPKTPSHPAKRAAKKRAPRKRTPKTPSASAASDASPPPSPASVIAVRGARQHNLKGLDIDIPLGRLTVVTGPSGSGKSSLAFHTLYAEGQRRYIETFSPYVRQFFDRMDKPAADRIDGIPPAIAIEQKNNVRTTRSTVGTLTETNDYLKLLFSRVARAYDPSTGEEIRPDSPESAAAWILESHRDAPVLVAFPVPVPPDSAPADIFPMLAAQGYLRVLAGGEILRTDETESLPAGLANLSSPLPVVQDRVKATPRNRLRLVEALESAFRLGKGQASAWAADPSEKPGKPRSLPTAPLREFSSDWKNPATGFTLRPPTPALFTFNNPLGACPKCRGFGRVIGLDLSKAVPDPTISIRDGAVRPFRGERGAECQQDLVHCCIERDLDIRTPWEMLTDEEREWVLYGDMRIGAPDRPGGPNDTGTSDFDIADQLWREGRWYGVKGFFDWIESKTYRMHIRVFLSKYRSYTTCPDCRGRRLQPEALCFKIAGKTLPDLWRMPVADLANWFARQFPRQPRTTDNRQPHPPDSSLRLILTEITSRLRYLLDVGLGYLTLDRATRTLSGGEIERVNLTSCLGASLTSTLFVLDEPTVGLHQRDIARLIGVMHGLRDKGNTLVVVEHEESVMRAADHLLDLGPGAGEHGGQIIYQGVPPQVPNNTRQVPRGRKESPASSPPLSTSGIINHNSKTPPPSQSTLSYLSGKASIPVPARRRNPGKAKLAIKGATRHNLDKLAVEIPLGLFVCLTGVSGSGKSTLARDVLHLNLARHFGEEIQENPARVTSIKGVRHLSGALLVDQSPLARTPRSTPAVLLGAFNAIRKLFALAPDAQSRGLIPSHFSFNSGIGRCDRCNGTGFEKVEMQFLSDIFVTCPDCGGRRYKPSTLDVKLRGHSIADVLDLTAAEASEFLRSDSETPAVQQRLMAVALNALQPLLEVGLGYLRLGQPLNTLSGGESQRLKLCRLLAECSLASSQSDGADRFAPSEKPKKSPPGKLLILDEPTTGLHFSDIQTLLGVFQRLVDAGHSLLVIEHNLDVIKCADWLLDLGPEAGAEGGRIVGSGPPELVATLDTPTAAALRPHIPKEASSKGATAPRRHRNPSAASSAQSSLDSGLLSLDSRHDSIILSGAREHNLKNISLEIPRGKFVVVSGLSGSGKSTLAFDILFAEGQRRFLDSMSVYARQFAEQLEKPDIDRLAGLPPTVAIEQRVSQGGNKSTVATVTEIWNFVRLLYSKIGVRHCPDCGVPVEPQSLAAIESTIRKHLARGPVTLLAPVIRARKGYHTDVAEWAAKQGFEKLLVDRRFRNVANFRRLERYKEHDIDVVVAELPKGRGKQNLLGPLLEQALKIGNGTIRILAPDKNFIILSTESSCPVCNRSFDELDPLQFSFNSPRGWCHACRGHGLVPKRGHNLDPSRHESILAAELEADRALDRTADDDLALCPACMGTRLNPESSAVVYHGLSIADLARLPIDRAAGHFKHLVPDSGRSALIARDILPEIAQRLAFLQQVGLGYLQLDRSARTLSGGENQRIRLAAQLGSNLRGVLYILDEPTIGLHPNDNEALLSTLAALRDHGNSLLVVEHDEETISRADHLIDLGPGAGEHGGQIVFQGALPKAPRGRKGGTASSSTNDQSSASPTLRALFTPFLHPIRGARRKTPAVSAPDAWIRLDGCLVHNLHAIDVRIPLSRLTVITGVSGSGKSTLMHNCLAAAARDFAGRTKPRNPKSARRRHAAPPLRSASGFGRIRHTYEVDQSPIGKTSRSCPATYVKIFDDIRKLYAQLPEARVRGFSASRFSFNNTPGRCPECKGNGRVKIEMDFLPTTWVHCTACRGQRYNPATLEVLYRGKSIADVLEMSISEAAELFDPHPRIAAALRLLADTGLGYLRLGQPSPTLSGGEAQRLKLVTELIRGRSPRMRISNLKSKISNLYLIEEPSVGLHHDDVRRLIDVLHRLVDEGHTVVVIEHQMDIAAEADHIIDLGPGAGAEGGRIVARGTPEHVAKSKRSKTAPFLRKALRGERL